MDPAQDSLVLPSISVVLPPSSSEEDARAVASEKLSDLLKGRSFEIVAVDLLEEGAIRTPIGVTNGKRYMISFRRTENVVYLHPDYYEIVAEYNKKRTGKR
jgi:hypothetical protein